MTRRQYAMTRRNETTTYTDVLWQQDLDTINRVRLNYLFGRVWGSTLQAYPIELIVQAVNQSIEEASDVR